MFLDKKGQVTMAVQAVGMIVGILVLIIFVEFYAGANKTNISTSATNVLDLADLVLAAGIIIPPLVGMMYLFSRR